MRQRGHMKASRNSGIALVTVLLVAAVTIALAYGALSISTSALRGTKGAESSIQARLNAESGLDASFVYIEDLFRKEENASAFDYIPSITPNHGPELAFNETYKFAQKPILVGDNITLIVNGHVSTSDTVYTTNADVYYNPGGGGSSTDPNASPENPTVIQDLMYRGITSCSVVQTGGSSVFLGGGHIYVEENASINSGSAVVEGHFYSPKSVTITNTKLTGSVTAQGDITINNGKKDDIYANLLSAGRIQSTNSGAIFGDIKSHEDITLSGGDGDSITTGTIAAIGNVTINNKTVNSNVYAQGDIDLGGATINGDVYTNGSLSMNNTTVNGQIYAQRIVKMSNSTVKGSIYVAKDAVIGSGSTSLESELFVGGNLMFQGGGVKVAGSTTVVGSFESKDNGNAIGGDLIALEGIKLTAGITVSGSVFSAGMVSMSGWGLVVESNLYTSSTLDMSVGAKIGRDAYVDGQVYLNSQSSIGGRLYSPNTPVGGSPVGGHQPTNHAGSSKVNALTVLLDGELVPPTNIRPLIPSLINEGIAEYGQVEPITEFLGCNVQEEISLYNEIIRLENKGAPFEGIRAADWPGNGEYVLQPGRLTRTYKKAGNTVTEEFSLTTLRDSFFEQAISYHHFRNLGINGEEKLFVRGGDVTLVVDSMIALNFPEQLVIDSDSSLTIITRDQIKINNWTKSMIPTHEVLNSNKTPSLTFYSSASGVAFDLSTRDDTPLRALVYTPNGEVNIHSSKLEGAVVGGKISLVGDGIIEYDGDLIDLIGKRNPPAGEGEEGLVIVKRR